VNSTSNSCAEAQMKIVPNRRFLQSHRQATMLFASKSLL